jgi:hypothetical protein
MNNVLKKTALFLFFSVFLVFGTAVMSNADVSLPEDLENEKEYATKEEKKLAADFLRLLDDNSRFSSDWNLEAIKGIERPQPFFSTAGLSIYGYSKKEKQWGVLVSDFGKERKWYPQGKRDFDIDADRYYGMVNSTFYFIKQRASEGWFSEGNIYEGKIDAEGKIRFKTIFGEPGYEAYRLLHKDREKIINLNSPGKSGIAEHSSAKELTLKSGKSIRLLSGEFMKGGESVVRLYVLDENDKLLYSLPLALPPIRNTYFFLTEDGVIARDFQPRSDSISEKYFTLRKFKLNEKKIRYARSVSTQTDRGTVFHLLVHTIGTEGDVFYTYHVN